MQKVFSEKLDIKLIKLVREHPLLYDYNDLKYLDFNAREVAWHIIGEALGKPAACCKVRWINIRDAHRRILRRLGPGCSQLKRGYKYDQQLEFVKSFYKETVPVDAVPESEEETDEASVTNSSWTNGGSNFYIEYEDSSNEADQKPLKKRKKPAEVEKLDSFKEVEMPIQPMINKPDFDVSDSVDAFLVSIGATLKKFSPYHLNLVESKIFEVVQEHDLEQIVERQPRRTDSSITSAEFSVFYQR